MKSILHNAVQHLLGFMTCNFYLQLLNFTASSFQLILQLNSTLHCSEIKVQTFWFISLASSRASSVDLDSCRVYSVSLFIFSNLRCNFELRDSDFSLTWYRANTVISCGPRSLTVFALVTICLVPSAPVWSRAHFVLSRNSHLGQQAVRTTPLSIHYCNLAMKQCKSTITSFTSNVTTPLLLV